MFWKNKKDKIEPTEDNVAKDEYWTERRKLNLEVWEVLRQFVIMDKLKTNIDGISIEFKKQNLGQDKYGYERYIYKMFMNKHAVLCFNDYDFNDKYVFSWESWVNEYDKIETYSKFILDAMTKYLNATKEEEKSQGKNKILSRIQDIGL